MTDIPVGYSLPQQLPARAVTTEWIKAHLARMDHADPLLAGDEARAARDPHN
ncbi:hypothetical protein [Rhodococcus jostii]|uniref:Uncharacterized protein n=1 Tax=Rhodococcus jostii TaxID=132919 RepID=A0A1H5MJC0_RHOJO|nr:hypothetical protein [Rhodococcus jostii]SEE89210.1 hypothetical protein SAMN04490220_9031 [Rhodococcus jostii]